jgi:hypothetical protein
MTHYINLNKYCYLKLSCLVIFKNYNKYFHTHTIQMIQMSLLYYY